MDTLQKATVIAASRILRWHCFKCKIPSSAITLHMIFSHLEHSFFIIYSAIFPPDTGIFLPPQKNTAALYAFCSIFILTVYVCANVAISFISIFGFAAYHPFVLTAILLNIQILISSHLSKLYTLDVFFRHICNIQKSRIICTYSSIWASFRY